MEYFDKKQVAKKLKGSEALVVKYTLLFEAHDYEFINDGETGTRLYTDQDINLFLQVIALKKEMKVEEAVKRIVKGNEVTVYKSVTPALMDQKLDTILQELIFIKQQNEELKKEVKENKEELSEVKGELAEVKEVVTDRDYVLMGIVRSLQETASSKKKRWYDKIIFWK